MIALARERRPDEREFEKYEDSQKVMTFTHVTRNSRHFHRRLWRRGRRTLMGHPEGRTACRSLWSPEITQASVVTNFLLAIDNWGWLILSFVIIVRMINILSVLSVIIYLYQLFILIWFLLYVLFVLQTISFFSE